MKIQTRTWRAALVLASCPLAASAQTAAPVITPAPSAPPAQTVTLRLKFTPGQTLYYRLTTDTAGLMLTGQSGAGIPIKNHMEMLLHQTVKDVRATDGAATVDSGIDTMTMSMNGQTFPIPEDKLAQMKSVGKMLILPTGKVLSFTPNAALGAPAMPGMDMSHLNSVSGLGQLPDAPVKVGDTWKSAITAGITGAQMTSTFTLGSIDMTGGKTVAVINQTTDGTFDTSGANATASEAMGMKMLGKMNGTGVLRFDVDAGSIESVTSHLNMTMTMGPKGSAAGMKMQMKIGTDMKRAEAPAPVPPAAVPPV